jgi:hypothetical protein
MWFVALRVVTKTKLVSRYPISLITLQRCVLPPETVPQRAHA